MNFFTLRRGQGGTYHINKLLAAMRLLMPSAALAAPVNAVAATLATALAGNNNDLDFTAKLKGTTGNAITIRYVDPGVETATESVAVVGSAITVTLRSVSAVLSTAAQVKAAIDGYAAATALVSVANHAGNDGTGAVIALAATNLAGGVDGTVAAAWEQRVYGGYVYLNASDTPASVSTANWYKFQLTLV